MSTSKLKRDIYEYFQDFPDEALDQLAPRVETTLRDALSRARTGMIIRPGANNLRIEGLPNIKFDHMMEFNVRKSLQLEGLKVGRVKTKPTFSAGILFHLCLPFRIEIEDTDYYPVLRVTEALEIDLSFSDEINEIYFDYLSDL